MLDKIFNDKDSIEIRCIHKDQKRNDQGYFEPAPQFFFGDVKNLRKKSKKLKALNADGYNIYFGANPRVKNSTKKVACCNSLFVDLDNIELVEANKQLKSVRSKYLLHEPTLALRSGGGVHFYWKLEKPMTDLKAWTAIQKKLIQAFDFFAVKGIVNGKEVITSGVDKVIHDPQRIMRLAGFTNHKWNKVALVASSCGEAYSNSYFDYLPDVVVPEYISQPQVMRPDGTDSDNYSRAAKYFSMREGTGKGNLNNEAFKIAIGCINDFELTVNDTVAILSDWNLKNSPTMKYNELQDICKKAQSTSRSKKSGSKNREASMVKSKPAPIETMDYQPPANVTPIRPDVDTTVRKSDGADFSVVADMVEKYILVIGTTDVWDIEIGMMMSCASLRLQYPNEYKHWLRDYSRQVIKLEDLVFRPDGVLKEGQINTFRGFSFARDEREPVKLISHIEMLCNDDEGLFMWLISWMAIQVQRKGTKLATSVIMHGKQGTGKSMLWQCFGSLFGEYFNTITQQTLESDYNVWASRKTFVLAEEVLANRSKSKMKNIIKEMITGGKIIINQKYMQNWTEDCYMNMVFLSNNKLPMLLDAEDRRFTVIRCDNVQSEEYYSVLMDEINDNGSNRLYNFLMNWDLAGFHAHTKPFMTSEKQDLIGLAKDSAKIFIDDWLTDSIDGLSCLACIRSELFDAYREWCKVGLYRISTRTDFYSTVRNDYSEIEVRAYQGTRVFVPPTATTNTPHEFNNQLKPFIKKLASNLM